MKLRTAIPNSHSGSWTIFAYLANDVGPHFRNSLLQILKFKRRSHFHVNRPKPLETFETLFINEELRRRNLFINKRFREILFYVPVIATKTRALIFGQKDFKTSRSRVFPTSMYSVRVCFWAVVIFVPLIENVSVSVISPSLSVIWCPDLPKMLTAV